MGECKDLTKDEWLSESVLVGCSWLAVVSIYQIWSTGDRIMGGHGLLMPVWFNSTPLALTAEEVKGGSARKVLEYIVYHGLLCVGQHHVRTSVKIWCLIGVYHFCADV